MDILASVLKSLNRLKEAEELYSEALNFFTANPLQDHAVIGNSMNNLA